MRWGDKNLTALFPGRTRLLRGRMLGEPGRTQRKLPSRAARSPRPHRPASGYTGPGSGGLVRRAPRPTAAAGANTSRARSRQRHPRARIWDAGGRQRLSGNRTVLRWHPRRVPRTRPHQEQRMCKCTGAEQTSAATAPSCGSLGVTRTVVEPCCWRPYRARGPLEGPHHRRARAPPNSTNSPLPHPGGVAC